MALHLELRDRNNDPWHVCEQAFHIINLYLQPSSAESASEAAAKIDALAPGKRELRQGEECESSESFLLELWETFLFTVCQLPSDHLAHVHMVELLRELTLLDTPRTERQQVAMWPYLPRLDDIIKDDFREPEDTSEQALNEWINLNSFIARLYKSGLCEPLGLSIVLWRMRVSLESLDSASAKLEECRLMVAARYIRHNAAKLYSLMHRGRPTAREQQIWKSKQFEKEKGVVAISLGLLER